MNDQELLEITQVAKEKADDKTMPTAETRLAKREKQFNDQKIEAKQVRLEVHHHTGDLPHCGHGSRRLQDVPVQGVGKI